MQHKVKVTVIDKKLYPTFSRSTAQTLIRAPAPATTWATSSYSSATAPPTTFGTWA